MKDTQLALLSQFSYFAETPSEALLEREKRERTCLSHFTLTLPLHKISFNPKPTSTFILLRTRPGEATMDARTQYNPRTVEEVFRDFKGRRAGLIKALTTGISNKPYKTIFLFFFSNRNFQIRFLE